MVTAANFEFQTSTGGLGGVATGVKIPSANPNNIFGNVPQNELVVGEDYYACVYLKNQPLAGTETMDNVKVWLSSKSFPHDTELKWGFDPITETLERPFLKFDGTNDYVDCGNQATLWSQSLTKFSFSFWMNPNDLSTAQNCVRHGTAGSRFRAEFAPSNVMIWHIRNIANSAEGECRFTGITAHQWQHIVCTYDNSLGSNNLKIYRNGVLGTNTTNLTEAVNVSAILTLGGDSTFFNGFMKDFRWWTTKALSQAEIDIIYAGEEDGPTPDYWLRMDEGTGNPKDVLSEGVLTGVLTNGTSWSNGTAQTIANKYTAPTGVTWHGVEDEPAEPNIGRLLESEFLPIWLWLHVPANSEQRADDTAIFSFNIDIPLGGTGSTGGGDTGGTGGNPPPPVTPPPPGSSSNYKIAVVGDEGCENETDDVIDLIKSQGYNHVVSIGDHAYASASCWTSRFNTLKSKMESAFGNHEYSESGGIAPYKTFFGYSKTYFTYKFENIMFIVADTNINCDAGSTQHNALKAAITASLTDNTITWRIGVMHHPWFGAGSDHTYNDVNQVQAFHTLFQNNGVKFVLTGHNHNFQRTKQVIYNSSNPENPTVVDSSSPFTRATKGLIHVVSGAGGHDSGSSLYSLGSTPSFQGYQSRTWNGVWEIVASNGGNTLTCAFRDTDGNTHDVIVMTA